MNNYPCNLDSDYISHYGILGMKWGVRRYQNADGTLTPAGKKRVEKYNTWKSAQKEADIQYEKATAAFTALGNTRLKRVLNASKTNTKEGRTYNKEWKKYADLQLKADDMYDSDLRELHNELKKNSKQVLKNLDKSDKSLYSEEANKKRRDAASKMTDDMMTGKYTFEGSTKEMSRQANKYMKEWDSLYDKNYGKLLINDKSNDKYYQKAMKIIDKYGATAFSDEINKRI